jgi:CubicO group peptidase (beta-lactamase class C family)
MKTRATLLLALVLLAFVAPAWAQQPLPSAKPEQVGMSSQRLDRVGQMLKAQIERERFPGAVAIVARKGKIVYFEAFGQRDPQTGAPMSKDAIFRLYSMTKPFTSVAAMMLVEDGKLTLADPVSKHLPQLAKLQVAVAKQDADGKTSYTLVPAANEITIQDLLRHTSGIVYGGFTPNSHIKEAYAANKVGWDEQTPEEQLERLAKVPLAHQPGTVWEYSLSTDILGRVVEKVSGTTLGAVLNERLFAPLKMPDTSFVVPQGKVARLAQPYAVDKATGNPIKMLDVTVQQKNDAGGAGSAGTAADYARFCQMLLNGGQLNGVRLLGRATVAYMATDHLDTIKTAVPNALAGYGFGLGFSVRKNDGVSNLIGSTGEYGWGGAAGTTFWIDPKEQVIGIVMTQTNFGTAAQRLDRGLFRHAVYQALTN